MHKFKLNTYDGLILEGSKWQISRPKAVVCLVHGMSEYMYYYRNFAQFLNLNEISVYGFDHRGHGFSVSDESEIGHIADEEAFGKCAKDVVELMKIAKLENPEIPVILFGHSMGSLICRLVMSKHKPDVSGVILSGTAGHPGLKGFFGLPFVKLLIALKGNRYRSVFVEKLVFGRVKRFKPMLTHKDWLSRDETFLLEFTSDSRCNKVFTVGFYYDLGRLARDVNTISVIKKYNPSIPWFLFSGSEDQVGNFGVGVKQFFAKLKIYIRTAELKIYEDGRHVMLCETNKDQVYKDVLDFIKKCI
ncbi:MAG: alpha/beta fold hydrolase [Flavobacteriales bacterium]